MWDFLRQLFWGGHNQEEKEHLLKCSLKQVTITDNDRNVRSIFPLSISCSDAGYRGCGSYIAVILGQLFVQRHPTFDNFQLFVSLYTGRNGITSTLQLYWDFTTFQDAQHIVL